MRNAAAHNLGRSEDTICPVAAGSSIDPGPTNHRPIRILSAKVDIPGPKLLA
jgi:hypothetical protein